MPEGAAKGGDSGSGVILGIGLMAVCLLAFTVLVDASTAFLQRRELVSLADAAALAGAQGIDRAAYYQQGASPATRLDPAQVRSRVQAFLAGSHQAAGIRLDTVSTDGAAVLVVISAPVDGAFDRPSGERMVVTARARLAYAASG